MTKLKTNDETKVKYSNLERSVFKYIPKNGTPISSHELYDLVFQNNPPFHGQNYISTAVRNLCKKTKINKEDFKVVRGKPTGCKPIEVWIEK